MAHVNEGDPPGLGPWRSSSASAGFDPFPDSAIQGSVGDRFFEVAAKHPDGVALSSPAGRWTYLEMAEEVRRTAAGLRSVVQTTSPTPVALLAAHDGPLVVAMMSVIAAGHVVVVLDPTAPAETTDHVLRESGAPVLVHDESMATLAKEVGGRQSGVRCVSVTELGGPGGEDELPVVASDAPLMLAFTSGTSGSAKGAVITHGVILNVVRGATNALGVTSDDRMPMLFPVSLAVAAYPMFIPLLNGGTLSTLDVRGVGLAPVPSFLVEERITLAYMAPTVVRFLVDAVAGFRFPDLRMIALGGEVVDAEVVRLTTDLFGPDLLANGFGTTESGVITLYVIDPAVPPEGAVPSGYPVPEVDLFVLDDSGNQVPAGGSGEVAVASPHMFRGYWGHDELDEQVLAADPHGRPGWQLYRTGDLGRLDDHGALVVLGRLDTKVKVRGRFVVLGDVEAALHELDAVADAAVIAGKRAGNVELCAVVVPSGEGATRPSSLRAQLLARHEAYRVPSRWTLVDELPRLPNGKVDRRALLEVADAGQVAEDTPGSPSIATIERSAESDRRRVEVQRALRDLWEELLPVDAVGPDDDFLEMGGDSLLAAQMLVVAEQRLGVAVPMGELLHARTLRQLAEVVVRTECGHGIGLATCVQPGDETERPRLWFVHDLQGSSYRIRHLAPHVGSDQPLWSFESPLLAGEPNRFDSLDTFAARYVTELLAAQPDGPYWLGGYSFGGICAYEMARQLRRDGHQVAFLGIVDVGPGYRGPNWRERQVPFRPWFGVERPPAEGSSPKDQARHYIDMVRRTPVGALRHLMVRSGLYRYVDPLRFSADLRRSGRIRPEWRLWYAWEEHWKLSVRAWDRTRPYDGHVDLLWASQTGSTDNTMGWGPLVADLHIHRFDGFHDDLLEERGAPALGTALRSVLDAHLCDG